jgi:outer membrane lipopolysaccharide assembly protein LptE/RlpB
VWYISGVLRGVAWSLGVGVLALAGCGYALAGSGVAAGSFAIQTPRNDSFQPGVEYVVADALRREWLRRSGAALVEDPARADVVVTGRVLPLETRAQSLSSAILAREPEITLTLELQAMRRDGSALSLSPGPLSESERYLASADVEAQRKNRDEALRRLADVLATRFFDDVGEALSP